MRFLLRHILRDIRRLIMVAIALSAGAPSLMALAPVGSLPLQQQSSATSDPFLLLLPAALHFGEDVRPAAPVAVPSLRDSLLQIADKYAGETYIPYVWGGDAVGSKAACAQCRACIGLRHHLKGARQPGSCEACKECGMDCSHFVQRVFREAGLGFPYLPTIKLKHLSPTKLRQSNLVDIGHDLKLARPGDLLLHKNHIVLLLEKSSARIGDVIHVSRRIKHGKVGGVEVVRNADLEQYRGKVLRILRHVAIDRADRAPPVAKPLLVLPIPKSYEPVHQRIVRAE